MVAERVRALGWQECRDQSINDMGRARALPRPAGMALSASLSSVKPGRRSELSASREVSGFITNGQRLVSAVGVCQIFGTIKRDENRLRLNNLTIKWCGHQRGHSRVELKVETPTNVGRAGGQRARGELFTRLTMGYGQRPRG